MLFQKVQDLCKERNISVTKLETSISVGKGTILKWKTMKPKADTLYKVAQFFGLPMEYFLEEQS